MSNFFITMSGGTTQVINATLVGVLNNIRKYFPHSRIYAGFPGILGALSDNYVDISSLNIAELRKLYRTPASGFIGTTRVKILGENEYAYLDKLFKRLNVSFFLNIGGSGTIKQTLAVHQHLQKSVVVAALPKTVDNDFGDKKFDDVYFTPGFPSCANYWRHKTHVMNLEGLGSYSHDAVLIAQTFGRKTGFIAGCARLADPDRKLPLMILLPEDQRPTDEVVAHIRQMVEARKRVIVVMTEGYEVFDYEKKHDPSGQVMYGSSRNTSAQLLVNVCMDHDISARAFIPGFDQRSEMRFTSTIDLEAAAGVGAYAIRMIAEGHGQFFASICRNENGLNGIGFRMIELAGIKDYGREMSPGWIRYGSYDVTDSYVEYVEPLIGIGQVPVPNNDYAEYFSYPSGL